MNEIINACHKRFFHKFYMLLSVLKKNSSGKKFGQSLYFLDIKLSMTGKCYISES